MKRLELSLRKILINDTLYYFLIILALTYTLIFVLKTRISLYNIDDNRFYGTVTKCKFKDDKLQFTLHSKEDLIVTYFYKNNEEKDDLENKIKQGLLIEVEGNLMEPNSNTIPNTFNYRDYLRFHDIN